MPQVTIQFELPDDATYRDLRDTLKYVSHYTVEYRGPQEQLEINDDADIKSESGDVIGHWNIEE